MLLVRILNVQQPEIPTYQPTPALETVDFLKTDETFALSVTMGLRRGLFWSRPSRISFPIARRTTLIPTPWVFANTREEGIGLPIAQWPSVIFWRNSW